jgi:hypothetical protein
MHACNEHVGGGDLGLNKLVAHMGIHHPTFASSNPAAPAMQSVSQRPRLSQPGCDRPPRSAAWSTPLLKGSRLELPIERTTLFWFDSVRRTAWLPAL